MNLRFLLAGLCSLTSYSHFALADDDGESAESSASSTEGDDSDSDSEGASEASATTEELKWKWFGIGLGARRGPVSGATGWWGDLLLSARTGFSGPVGLRFELSGSIARLKKSGDIEQSILSDANPVHNDESMDLYSGLFRIALEVPVDPLVVRIGPAAGAGAGKYHSSIDSCGTEDWSRAMFGGGIDGVVGVGDPVYLEPFVRFDVLYLANPECVKGDPASEGSPTLGHQKVRYSDDVGLFVGAGLVLAL